MAGRKPWWGVNQDCPSVLAKSSDDKQYLNDSSLEIEEKPLFAIAQLKPVGLLA